MLKKFIFVLSLSIVFAIVFGNLPIYGSSPIKGNVITDFNSKTIENVLALGLTFTGKPYRSKVKGFGNLDCSTFISYIFSKNNIDLPRSPDGLLDVCDKIDLKDIKKGDLLFYKGQNIKSKRVGHVAIVTYVDSNAVIMLHSSIRGINNERMDSLKYYQIRFITAGRLKIFNYSPPEPLMEQDSSNISIIAVGDIMLGSNFPSKAYLPPNDGKAIFNSTKHILQDADVTFGNLEGSFLTEDAECKKHKDSLDSYAFKSPTHYAKYLADAGFDLLSLANNHIGDFYDVGINSTKATLDSVGIAYAGVLSKPYTIIERNNVKFGFAAFSNNAGVVSYYDTSTVIKIIRLLDSLCNVVIVSMHIGSEGQESRHITFEEEEFLKEKRGNPNKFAKLVIDSGADLVLGHGPHVVRAVDIYKNKFIAYSLGNFFTYGRFSLANYKGRSPILKILLNKNGDFLEADVYSTIQPKKATLNLDNKQTALKDIIELTNSDFPNSELEINKSGKILRKLNNLNKDAE